MGVVHTQDVFARWRELLRFVQENKHSEFYRRRFAAADFEPERDFRSLDDVRKIPFLNKADLAAADAAELLFVPESEVQSVAATSGTTSATPLVLYRSREHENGVRPHFHVRERVLVLQSPLQAGKTWAELHHAGRWGLLGDIRNLPATCALAERLGVMAIKTTPTLALLLRPHLSARPAFAASLRRLELGGEPISPHKKRLLHELYPEAALELRYSCSEAGNMGVSCAHLAAPEAQGGEILYHLNPDCFLEIIDPESGAPAAEGERGELVVTTFWNRATPLARYRTGDLASFVENNCPCGAEGPLVRVHGRAAQDSVRAGGFELRRDMLEAPLLRLRGLVRGDFEVRVREEYVGGKPYVHATLHLALQEGIADSPETKRRVAREFAEHWRVSPTLTLGAAIEAGHFAPLDIMFADFPPAAKAVARMILE